MTHNTDIDDIEAGLERDRSSLASTLNELQDRTSVERLASDALGMIRSNAAAYTSSLDQAVRANPMAFALTGVGLLWLVFGGSKQSTPNAAPQALSRWEDEGGRPGRQPPGYDAQALDAHKDEAWYQSADEHRKHASGLLDWLEEEARAARNSTSETFDNVRDFAAERAKIVADFTAGLKESLLHGLEDLSEDARKRILAVREKAYGARLHGQRKMSGLRQNPGRVLEDHPMVVGAVALALGAALGAALPRSRYEDRTFGSESDQLMADARRVLREERETLTRAVGGLAQDLRKTAKEGLAEVAKTAEKAADKTADKAEKESEKAGQKGKGPANDSPVAGQSSSGGHKGTDTTTDKVHSSI